jgi:hypothetical protein
MYKKQVFFMSLSIFTGEQADNDFPIHSGYFLSKSGISIQ